MKLSFLKANTYKLKPISGFTLIELLVVIAIISLLSSIVLASLGQARSKARDSKRVQDLIQLRTALELYAADHNGEYPDNPVGGSGVFRLSCWQCQNNFFQATGDVSVYDPQQLIELSPYLNPRPSDPLKPDGGQFDYGTGSYQGTQGYYYKVSDNRRNYKLILNGTIENSGNIPSMFIDNNFSAYTAISISTELAKGWSWQTFCGPPPDPDDPHPETNGSPTMC